MTTKKTTKETVDDAGGGLPCAGAAGRRRDILSAGTRGGVRGVAGRKPQHRAEGQQERKVLVCTPLNEDAKAILADMGGGADLKGAKLDVAVNAIVGSLVRNGYLNSISSAIMISVEDNDTAAGGKAPA